MCDLHDGSTSWRFTVSLVQLGTVFTVIPSYSSTDSSSQSTTVPYPSSLCQMRDARMFEHVSKERTNEFCRTLVR
jgi:hypothetical protein